MAEPPSTRIEAGPWVLASVWQAAIHCSTQHYLPGPHHQGAPDIGANSEDIPQRGPLAHGGQPRQNGFSMMLFGLQLDVLYVFSIDSFSNVLNF